MPFFIKSRLLYIFVLLSQPFCAFSDDCMGSFTPEFNGSADNGGSTEPLQILVVTNPYIFSKSTKDFSINLKEAQEIGNQRGFIPFSKSSMRHLPLTLEGVELLKSRCNHLNKCEFELLVHRFDFHSWQTSEILSKHFVIKEKYAYSSDQIRDFFPNFLSEIKRYQKSSIILVDSSDFLSKFLSYLIKEPFPIGGDPEGGEFLLLEFSIPWEWETAQVKARSKVDYQKNISKKNSAFE